MRPSLPLTFLLIATLAACGTPQQQCINTATRELRTIDRLVAETQATISRGYDFEQHRVVRHVWRRCDNWVPGTPVRMCFEPEWQTVKRPVAIDPAAETRKLDGLIARRKALEAQVRPAIASCQARYPE